MAQERISMRMIKEVLRLHVNGMSQNGIARVLKIGRGTVQSYLQRLKASNIDEQKAAGMSERELEALLFPLHRKGKARNAMPEYQKIFEELIKPHATREVLWEEYKQAYPDGYSYSHFCVLLREHRASLRCDMRQEHKAGDKTFVDFGEGPIITNRETGIQTKTRMFVSVWGASLYLYAHVVPNETLEQWIRANRAAFEYYGCCPHAVVPDNLRAAVTKACKYEPTIHPTYLEFARHYDTVIYPARPYKPKDKAKVENAVRLVQRWMVFRLRNRVFYSIAEAQKEVLALVERFNNRIMKQWNKSRSELFHTKGDRICSHLRSYQKHGATTLQDHMPMSHQKYAEWTPHRIMTWAEKYGDAVKELITHIMQSRRYPEQAYKSCVGIIRLGNKFPSQRLNDACKRALNYRAYSYGSVVTILEKGLDRQQEEQQILRIEHENIRGANYYETGNTIPLPA